MALSKIIPESINLASDFAGMGFGGTGAANQLDDYEEGTYLPTIGGSSALGTTTYSEQAGVYTKIGNMVRFSGSIQFSGHSGSSGIMAISLPFATGGASWQGNFTLAYQSGFSAMGYAGYTDPGRADFFIRKDGAATTLIDAAEIPSGGHVIFGGTFVTTA